MEIKVLGDFDFAREIISGVARLFSYDNGFGYASGILLALFLLWSGVKHAIDPEKSPPPIREFGFGIALWLMLGGGGTSAKFDVELTSISDPMRFEQIQDVPALAAVPAWLASNVFESLRTKMENEFSPPTYSIERGIDPLGALVRMFDNAPPMGLLHENKDEDIAKTMNAYMTDCWLADHQLDHASPTVTIADLLNTDMTVEDAMINAIKVDYNGLVTRIYIGSSAQLREPGQEYGIAMTCPDAWAAIKEKFKSNGSGATKLMNWQDGRNADAASTQAALAFITNSYSSTPSAFHINVNLFAASLAAEGVTSSSIATDAHRMVFEAYRKNAYAKAGEASIFNSLLVPVTTALEVFSFFIAPIMMILSIMGGFGFAYIGKYLGLVLYVNLFGFIKVFVDVFTAISVQRAYEASDDLAQSFLAYPNTIKEIEGFLSISASLTTAIPMLALFLLYGGVHSIMGVMKQMGSVPVDGSAGAPSTSTSMNAGTRQIGNQTDQFDMNSGATVSGYASQSNPTAQYLSLNDAVTAGSGATVSAANNVAASQVSGLAKSLADVTNLAAAESVGANGSDGLSASKITGSQITQGLIKSVASALGTDETTATRAMLAAAVSIGPSSSSEIGSYERELERQNSPGGGGNTPSKPGGAVGLGLGMLKSLTGIDLSGSGSIGSTWTDQESLSKARQAMESYANQLTTQYSNADLVSAANTWSHNNTYQKSDAYTDMKQQAATISEADQVSRATQANTSNALGLSSNMKVDLNHVGSAINDNNLQEAAYNKLSSSLGALANSDASAGDRMVQAGLATKTSDGYTINQADLANTLKDHAITTDSSGLGMMDGMRGLTMSLLAQDNGDYKGSIADTKIAAQMWSGVTDLLRENGVQEPLVAPVAALSKSLNALTADSAPNSQLANYDKTVRDLEDTQPKVKALSLSDTNTPQNTVDVRETAENTRARLETAGNGKLDSTLKDQAQDNTQFNAEALTQQVNAAATGPNSILRAITGEANETLTQRAIDHFGETDSPAIQAAEKQYQGDRANINGPMTVTAATNNDLPNADRSSFVIGQQNETQPAADGLKIAPDVEAILTGNQGSSINNPKVEEQPLIPQSSSSTNVGASTGTMTTNAVSPETSMELIEQPLIPQSSSSTNVGASTGTITTNAVSPEASTELIEPISTASTQRPANTSRNEGADLSDRMPLFEGQPLSYENGRFEGIRSGDEIQVAGENYTFTGKSSTDSEGMSRQLFESNEQSYLWNADSNRMEPLIRDN